MKLSEFLQQQYGKRVFSVDHEDILPEDALCVGGALCAYLGYPKDTFPTCVEILTHIKGIGIVKDEEYLLTLINTMLCYNDKELFTEAWETLEHLLQETGLSEITAVV